MAIPALPQIPTLAQLFQVLGCRLDLELACDNILRGSVTQLENASLVGICLPPALWRHSLNAPVAPGVILHFALAAPVRALLPRPEGCTCVLRDEIDPVIRAFVDVKPEDFYLTVEFGDVRKLTVV